MLYSTKASTQNKAELDVKARNGNINLLHTIKRAMSLVH